MSPLHSEKINSLGKRKHKILVYAPYTHTHHGQHSTKICGADSGEPTSAASLRNKLWQRIMTTDPNLKYLSHMVGFRCYS